MKKILLLDLDDTILDNTDADVESFKVILDRRKITCPTKDQIIRWRRHGMLTRNMLLKILGCKKNIVEECTRERIVYLSKSLFGLKLKTDTNKMLNEVSPKYHIAIVTSRPKRSFVLEILKKLKVDSYVQSVLCAEDYSDSTVKFEQYTDMKKTLYKIAMARFDSNIEQCVVIGNLKSDISAALSLGIEAYAVRGSYRFDRGIRNMTKSFENIYDITSVL